MNTTAVKIGDNCARHLLKYPGSTEADYIEHAKRTAHKVTVNRLDTQICEKFKIYSISHLAIINKLLPDSINQRDPLEIIQSTENPYELAKMWIETKHEAESYQSKETVISEKLGGLKMECFERWGDKNRLSDVSKKWFDENAIPLDVQVESWSENTGYQITCEDVIEFIQEHKPGKYVNPMEVVLKEIESQFKEVCGFRIQKYYAEHLVKCCEYYPEPDDKEDLPF